MLAESGQMMDAATLQLAVLTHKAFLHTRGSSKRCHCAACVQAGGVKAAGAYKLGAKAAHSGASGIHPKTQRRHDRKTTRTGPRSPEKLCAQNVRAVKKQHRA